MGSIFFCRHDAVAAYLRGKGATLGMAPTELATKLCHLAAPLGQGGGNVGTPMSPGGAHPLSPTAAKRRRAETLAQALASLRRYRELGGADLNAADYDGRRAIHLAAAEGHVATVEYLLSDGAGVDATLKDRFGTDALAEARKRGDANGATVVALIEAWTAARK